MLALGVLGVAIIAIWQENELLSYLGNIFSFDNIWTDLLIGVLIAIIFQLYVMLLIRYNRGDFPNTNESKLLFNLVFKSKYSLYLLSLLPAISEEILFRAALLGILVTSLSEVTGIIIVTIIFGLLHVKQYKGQIYFITYVFLLGASINLLFIFTGTLWGPLLVHFLNNYFSFKWVRMGKIKITN